MQDIVKQNADDLGVSGWDSSYGWGRVNAARAVTASSGPGGPDTTPPTVSITSPLTGDLVSATISVQVAANDNVGVVSVSLDVDGVVVGTDTASPYTFSWNTEAVNDGNTYTSSATAVDDAGNSASASIAVTVSNAGDTTAPAISIMSPANGATVSGNVSVLVNTSDNVGRSESRVVCRWPTKRASTSAPFTTKWNARKASGGAHTLQAKAYDQAGNSGASQTVVVYK